MKRLGERKEDERFYINSDGRPCLVIMRGEEPVPQTLMGCSKVEIVEYKETGISDIDNALKFEILFNNEQTFDDESECLDYCISVCNLRIDNNNKEIKNCQNQIEFLENISNMYQKNLEANLKRKEELSKTE